MRAIPAAVVLFSAAVLVAGVSACGENSAFAEPRILADTVTLAVPGEGSALPSAIDLVREVPPFTFRRFPEQVADAQQWDLALRRSGAALALRPLAIPGGGVRGTGIASATTDYDQLTRAPRGTAAYAYETITITEGATYVARSRQYAAGAGVVCSKYAKLKVLALDAVAGTARIAVSVNENCEDERLTA